MSADDHREKLAILLCPGGFDRPPGYDMLAAHLLLFIFLSIFRSAASSYRLSHLKSERFLHIWVSNYCKSASRETIRRGASRIEALRRKRGRAQMGRYFREAGS